jgi:predicted metal-dependent phosphoesterase TrpH
MPAEDLVRTAKERGLDGVCLTEHNKVHDPAFLKDLSKKYDITVLQGVEMVTLEGDILLFSEYIPELLEEIREVISVRKLKSITNQRGGAIIAAHPLRSVFLSQNDYRTDIFYKKIQEVCSRILFKWVDGMEACNGNDLDMQNLMALDVSKELNLATTGGSDAHCVKDVGKYFSIFDNGVSCERELVQALKEGRVKAGYREPLLEGGVDK